MLQWLAPSLAATLVSLAAGLAIFTSSMFLVDRKGLTEDWDVVRRLMKGAGSASAQAATAN